MERPGDTGHRPANVLFLIGCTPRTTQDKEGDSPRGSVPILFLLNFLEEFLAGLALHA